jgi:hypothetical protein
MVQAPYLVVLVGRVGGWITCWNSFKAGGFLIAAALIFGAAARALLPESRAGYLATRRRWTDVVTMAALGLGIAFLAWATHAA